ncbi:Peptidase family M3 containing protein [Aphelenchoides avenae]|nr:Peptidase family M3 containing protein [Aphelenchus avenae]
MLLMVSYTTALRIYSGLFGNPVLATADGFRKLTDDVERKAMQLAGEISERAKAPVKSGKTTVSLVDDLSNEICCAADLTDCVRNMHSDRTFVEAAEESMRRFTSLVETLNTTKDLYDSLNRSLKTEADRLDDVDIRTARLLLDDFEQSGIHLPDHERREFVELSNDIFEVGARFSDGVHQEVPISVEDQRTYKIQRAFLNSPWVHSGDRAGREFAYTKYLGHIEEQENLLRRLISSRHRLAKLTGFDTYADRAQRHTALQTYEHVYNFLNGIIKDLTPHLADEIHQIKRVLVDNTRDFKYTQSIGEWDVDFAFYIYRETLLSKIGDVSSFFHLGTVLEGLGTVVERLYGIKFSVGVPDAGEVWPGNVLKLDVHKGDTFLGTIYIDFDSRPTKTAGDCHFTVRCSKLLDNGEYQTPIVVLNLNNASIPTHQDPRHALDNACLTPQQAENFFHEMGHAMHSMLGRTRYQHVAGTRCPTDFAEVPSNLMELFFNNPRVLRGICKDKSGRAISADQAEVLIRSRRVFTTTSTLHQTLYSLFDLEAHGQYAEAISSGKLTTTDLFGSLAKEALPDIERPSNYAYHHRFTHLVPYGAKYYSYLVARAAAALVWQEMFEADPLSRENGLRWASVQAHGGEKPPNELLAEILGAAPHSKQLTEVITDFCVSDTKALADRQHSGG